MNVLDGNILFQGTITFGKTPTLPSGCITNGNIVASAGISASKVQQQRSINVELYGPTTTIAALTKLIFQAYGATGAITAAKASIVTVATGADRTVTVDIKKSTAGGAFSTILTSTIGFTNGSTALSPVDAVVNATPAAFVNDDIFEVVVTVAGAAGNQALGLIITMWLTEDPA